MPILFWCHGRWKRLARALNLKASAKVEERLIGLLKDLGSLLMREFQQDWLRDRRTLVDWERLIHACVGREEWGSAKPGWGKENRTRAANNTISRWDLCPAGDYGGVLTQYWRLRMVEPKVSVAIHGSLSARHGILGCISVWLLQWYVQHFVSSSRTWPLTGAYLLGLQLVWRIQPGSTERKLHSWCVV